LREFVPRLRDFVGALQDPWATTDLLEAIQELWDDLFPETPHIVALLKDPVYAVVCSLCSQSEHSYCSYMQAVQRVIEWRANIATSAVKVVAEFWESQPRYEQIADRMAFVTSILAPDYLYLYKYSNRSNPNDIVSFLCLIVQRLHPVLQRRKGTFQSALVIKTFVHHVRITGSIPDTLRDPGVPQGALALAAIAVCLCHSFFLVVDIAFFRLSVHSGCGRLANTV
jgi:hypothetical protein